MVAGQSAPRYQEMALLYPQSSNLKVQLSEYFIVIVNFCHHALKMSKKSILGQLLSFPSELDLNSFQLDLTRWANTIKEEVSLLMGQTIKEQSSSWACCYGTPNTNPSAKDKRRVSASSTSTLRTITRPRGDGFGKLATQPCFSRCPTIKPGRLEWILAP